MAFAPRPAPTRYATAPGYAVAPAPVPSAPSRRSYAGIVAVAVLVTMIAVGATVAVVWRPASTVATAGPVSVETVPASVAPPVAPASAPDALAQLKQEASEDSAAGEATVGSWVPQLASKKVGMVADGQTWDAADVLAEHAQLRASYPRAVLVWSGDYTTFTGASYWVTVVAEPSATAAGANAWCDSAGLDADHCYAKRLAHSGGPKGNTVPR